MKGKFALITKLLTLAGVQRDRIGDGASVLRTHALHEDNMRAMGELESIYRLRACLEEDDIRWVIDVGGNDGRFGACLRAAGFRGRIWSFEPNPDEYDRLSAAASADGDWRAEQLALGSEPGELTLHVTHTSQFASLRTAAPVDNQFSADLRVLREVRVPVQRLDDYLGIHGPEIRPDRTLLKVDTQGFDHQVLVGAGSFLQGIAAVLFEAPYLPIYQQVEPYTATFNLLNEAGLAISHAATVSRTPDQRLIVEADVLMRRALPPNRSGPLRQ